MNLTAKCRSKYRSRFEPDISTKDALKCEMSVVEMHLRWLEPLVFIISLPKEFAVAMQRGVHWLESHGARRFLSLQRF